MFFRLLIAILDSDGKRQGGRRPGRKPLREAKPTRASQATEPKRRRSSIP
jgi:hypothetical protein